MSTKLILPQGFVPTSQNIPPLNQLVRVVCSYDRSSLLVRDGEPTKVTYERIAKRCASRESAQGWQWLSEHGFSIAHHVIAYRP